MADLGAGLILRSVDGLSGLTVSYDAILRDDYVAHTGIARAQVNF
jgi:hypothetical protein